MAARKKGAGRKARPRYQYIGGKGVSGEAAADIGPIIRKLAKLPTTDQVQRLIEIARDPKSPAHKHFDFDAKRALEAYLKQQAYAYLRGIHCEVIVEEKRFNTRGFRPVKDSRGVRSYRDMGAITEDADLLEQVLEQAKRDLDSWRQQYTELRQLAEVSGVFREVDALLGKKAEAA